MLLSARACGRLASRNYQRSRARLAMRPLRPLPSPTSSAPCDGDRLWGGARPGGVAPPLHSLGVVLSGGGRGRREPPFWSPPPRVPSPSASGFWRAAPRRSGAVGGGALLSSRAVTKKSTPCGFQVARPFAPRPTRTPAECIAKRVARPNDPPTQVKDQPHPTAAESRVCAIPLRLTAAVGCS